MSLKAYEPSPGLTGSIASLANCFDPAGRSGAHPDRGGRELGNPHLIERGHRDIVMLTGTPDMVASGLREQGFAQGLADAGLPVSPPIVAGWEIDKGYAAAMHVLTTSDSRPTGLVVANDRAAIGVVLAATSLGLSVPTDVSVVGYDDDAERRTVAGPGADHGQTAAPRDGRVGGGSLNQLLTQLTADARA